MTDPLLAAPRSEPADLVGRPDTTHDSNSGAVEDRTATAREQDGLLQQRSDRAGGMLRRLAGESLDAAQSSSGEPLRVAALSATEIEVVAELLDELAGVCPGELLGQLAGSLSTRLWERGTPATTL